MELVEIILYVKDQVKSKAFYESLLQLSPSLDVPGMTEFELFQNVKLGLMPENGIAKIITPPLPHPSKANQVPRCELYIKVKNAETYINRAIQLGGREVNSYQNRDWGDKVGYVTDLDNHIIAFAENI